MKYLRAIAMPAFNEEGCVEQTVREALATLDDLDGHGEVLVVDDGSTDATPAILDRVAAEDSRVRVVHHPTNRGIAGFNRRMMTEARGDWVLFTSSDGEFNPYVAIDFIKEAEQQGADAVLGYRQTKNYNLWRLVVSWSFNSLTYLLFGTQFRDIGSTRLLRREVFQPLALYSQSAFLNAERLLAGHKLGAKIVEVPIEHRPRLAGVGSGSKPRKVAEATRDLLITRARWLRFSKFYRPQDR